MWPQFIRLIWELRWLLVEKDRLGCTCFNRGCIPTKALVRSAGVFLEARRAQDFGIEIDNIRVNFWKVWWSLGRVMWGLSLPVYSQDDL